MCFTSSTPRLRCGRTSTLCVLLCFCMAHTPLSSTYPRSCRSTPASTFCGGNGVFTHQVVNGITPRSRCTVPVSSKRGVLLLHLDERKQESHAQTLGAIVPKVRLTRDRDALGAAVGVRTIPAPHATLNGAPAALAMVHCLIASRVAAI